MRGFELMRSHLLACVSVCVLVATILCSTACGSVGASVLSCVGGLQRHFPPPFFIAQILVKLTKAKLG